MSFFHFHEPLGFLNAANDSYDPFGTRSKQYESTSEEVSGLLYAVTYWGDYGGDSVSRYHFDKVVENAGHLVTVVDGAYGKGLVLTHVYYGSDAMAPDSRSYFRSEIEFLKDFLGWASNAPSYYGMTREDYFIYDENDYSDWEFHKIEEILDEDLEGWLNWDIKSEFNKLTNFDSDEPTDEEIREAVLFFQNAEDRDYPYFESAVSVVYSFNADEIAQRILDARNGDVQSHQADSLF